MKTFTQLLNEGGITGLIKTLADAEKLAAGVKEASKIEGEVSTAAKGSKAAKEAGTAAKVERPFPFQLNIPKTSSEQEAREQLVDLRKKINDMLKDPIHMDAPSLVDADVPGFDDLFRRIYRDRWEDIAKEKADALTMLDKDPRLELARKFSVGIPYGDYQRVIDEPHRAPTTLQFDFTVPADDELLGSWSANPLSSDYGDAMIAPLSIAAEAQKGIPVSMRDVMKHEYSHGIGDIDWLSTNMFRQRGSKDPSISPFSLARRIVRSKETSPIALGLLDDIKKFSASERMAKESGVPVKPTDLKDMEYYRGYITPREFVGQAADIQSLLRRAGMPTVGPSNVFDQDYGIEAFKRLRNKFNIPDSSKLLSPLLLTPEGRALIAPVAKNDKASKVSDKIDSMRTT